MCWEALEAKRAIAIAAREQARIARYTPAAATPPAASSAPPPAATAAKAVA